MSINKYQSHLYIIPEDDANRQVIQGFRQHSFVESGNVNIRAPAGGWTKVVDVFVEEYVPLLRKWPNAHVLLVVDFDNMPNRRQTIGNSIPADLVDRVFLVGSLETPERLRSLIGILPEALGRKIAEECYDNTHSTWAHAHLLHNIPELNRLVLRVRPILFP